MIRWEKTHSLDRRQIERRETTLLTIAICDDDELQITATRDGIERFLSGAGIADHHIDVFTNPFVFLDHYDSDPHLDIAFLDICMPGIQGTEVAREIKAKHDATQIVFLTVSEEYAVDAFALHAAHYLIKPFTQVQLDEAMQRTLRNLQQREPLNMTCQGKGGSVHLVRIDEITHIESRGHTQYVHTANEVVSEEHVSLGGMLEKLESAAPGQFVVPYRGFIVNQKAIHQIEPEDIVLKDGTHIPIARRGYRKMRATYFDFIFSSER